MDSWWVPYLPKSCRPDFNQEVTRIVAPYCPQRLFEFDSNNDSSPSHSNLVSDRVYICSCLILMVFWWVLHLPKGCRPDFNNGLGGDSNSGPVLVPRRLFEPDSYNGPSPGHSNLVSDEVHISVQVFNF